MTEQQKVPFTDLDLPDQLLEGVRAAGFETCTPIREALPGEIFPPPTYSNDVFRITAEARYGDVKRTVEAVVDRSDVMAPVILSWRVR